MNKNAGSGKRGRPSRDDQLDMACVLSKATEVFAERGFDGASLREIAKRADVRNVSIINYHFGSKEDLWRAAITRLGDKLTTRFTDLSGVLRDVTGNQLLKAYMRQFIYFTAENPDFHRVIAQEMCAQSERTAWLVNHLLDPLHQFFESSLPLPESENARLSKIPIPNLTSLFIGAATTYFFHASQMKIQYDVDPFSQEEIEKHVEYVNKLFFD